jgi:DNA-binding XRE family transcriptional regulator
MSSRFRKSPLFEPPSSRIVADRFDPVRLTQARILASMTKNDLSEKLSVTAAAVGQYEAGISVPKPEQLDRIAEA